MSETPVVPPVTAPVKAGIARVRESWGYLQQVAPSDAMGVFPLSVRELANMSDAPAGVGLLACLEMAREGLLVLVPGRPGAMPRVVPPKYLATASPVRDNAVDEAVFLVLERMPGAAIRVISSELKRSPNTIHSSLRRLEAARRIHRPHGAKKGWWPKTEGAAPGPQAVTGGTRDTVIPDDIPAAGTPQDTADAVEDGGAPAQSRELSPLRQMIRRAAKGLPFDRNGEKWEMNAVFDMPVQRYANPARDPALPGWSPKTAHAFPFSVLRWIFMVNRFRADGAEASDDPVCPMPTDKDIQHLFHPVDLEEAGGDPVLQKEAQALMDAEEGLHVRALEHYRGLRAKAAAEKKAAEEKAAAEKAAQEAAAAAAAEAAKKPAVAEKPVVLPELDGPGDFTAAMMDVESPGDPQNKGKAAAKPTPAPAPKPAEKKPEPPAAASDSRWGLNENGIPVYPNSMPHWGATMPPERRFPTPLPSSYALGQSRYAEDVVLALGVLDEISGAPHILEAINKPFDPSESDKSNVMGIVALNLGAPSLAHWEYLSKVAKAMGPTRTRAVIEVLESGFVKLSFEENCNPSAKTNGHAVWASMQMIDQFHVARHDAIVKRNASLEAQAFKARGGFPS